MLHHTRLRLRVCRSPQEAARAQQQLTNAPASGCWLCCLCRLHRRQQVPVCGYTKTQHAVGVSSDWTVQLPTLSSCAIVEPQRRQRAPVRCCTLDDFLAQWMLLSQPPPGSSASCTSSSRATGQGAHVPLWWRAFLCCGQQRQHMGCTGQDCSETSRRSISSRDLQ